jgi:prepilin signal peptidase PulO-like enzyme (type II secretory pathway)
MPDISTILYALILLMLIGPAVGNYATSVVYRLPLRQTPFEKHPYCGHCGTMLAPKDLFPVFSYLSLRGKCRYCSVPIRFTYTAIELACGIIFALNYLIFSVSEQFILATAIGVFLTILCGLEYHERKLFPLILTYLFALAALLRVLQEGSIYPFVFSGFAMLFSGAVIWRIVLLFKGEKALAGRVDNPSGVADTPQMPGWLWLAVLLGIALPLPVAWYAAAAAIGLYALQRLVTGSRLASIPVAVATMGGLLWWLG